MKAPLYSTLSQHTLECGNGNAGLWYDKYCNKWQPIAADRETGNIEHYSLGEAKQEWIKTVTNPGRKVGDEKAILNACQRLNQLARVTWDIEAPQIFKTQWRFVTGLGREHPVENGFAWHHTLGVPYLPGSSVKGMVRAWAEHWLERDKKDPTAVARIFGPKGAGKAGNIIFFDALPTDPVRLEADVMTPHYGPYYADGEAPGDWHNPVPIPFLTVAAHQTFQFLIAPRHRDDEQSRQDAETARNWLKDALEWIGAGAKTAVGYGRFTTDGSGPTDQEIWEQASLRYEPGPKRLAATSGTKTATGNNDAITKWVAKKCQKNANKKNLKKGKFRADVIVEKKGNSYILLEVKENENTAP